MEGREILSMADSSVVGEAGPSSTPGVYDVPEALQVPTKAVTPGFQLVLSLANTVIWLSILPIGTILLPTQVAALDAAHKFSNLSIATAIVVLAAIITNPIAGALSDRTTSQPAHRRPRLMAATTPPLIIPSFID